MPTLTAAEPFTEAQSIAMLEVERFMGFTRTVIDAVLTHINPGEVAVIEYVLGPAGETTMDVAVDPVLQA